MVDIQQTVVKPVSIPAEKPAARRGRGRGSRRGHGRYKKLLIFLAFEIIFTAVTLPMLVFHGPFHDIKVTVVGASWSTLRHRYIASFFLSEERIMSLLDGSYAEDPAEDGESLRILDFGTTKSNKLSLYDIKGGDYNGKMLIVSDPRRIVAGYSGKMPKSGETTSVIARKAGAVAAVNAGGFMDQGWTGTGGSPMGFIFHNGKLIYNSSGSENIKLETVAFTNKGMLIVGRHTIKQLRSYGVKEGVSFGPPLVVNGKPTIKKGDGGWGIGPRTVMGQRANGEVLLLVINGRSLSSIGATLKDVQEIMLEFGAVNAVNLDGGSSSTMYFNGRIINRPSDKLGERTVPTAFLVMPPSGVLTGGGG